MLHCPFMLPTSTWLLVPGAIYTAQLKPARASLETGDMLSLWSRTLTMRRPWRISYRLARGIMRSSPSISTAAIEQRMSEATSQTPYQLFTKRDIPDLFRRYGVKLDSTPYYAAANVFPMRVSNYVAENLIDWSNVPNDPIFQLVFPQPGMLTPKELEVMTAMITGQHASRIRLRGTAEGIRANLNPHPGGQKETNVPVMDGGAVPGMQHKYRETVLFFPTEGQYCHSFCTYCFRWAQFTSVGSDQQFQSKDAAQLLRYLAQHSNVTDVLLTGGDPMVMTAEVLRRYIDPIIKSKELSHLDTIRIGSKSLAFWPYRFLTDPDAKAMLELFADVVKSGKHLAFQAHFSNPRELETEAVQEAIRLIRMTGANIRSQSPLIRHVNDSAQAWTKMWRLQTRLGVVPYYMFIERDTGARHYFSVSLLRAYEIYNAAYSSIGGTARTIKGPSMTTLGGKLGIAGTPTINGERVFALKFFSARNPEWISQMHFAKLNPEAVWFDELEPAFGDKKFFWEDGCQEIIDHSPSASSGQMF